MQREKRYTVLKNTDINAHLSADEQDQLNELCKKVGLGRILAGKAYLRCAVVESDWPEYERAWELIQARVNRATETEDDFNAEQAKAGGMPYGTYGGMG